MTTVTVSMPDSLKDFIETEVATKGYGNVSEYIRGLLRSAQTKAEEDRLESLLLEGLASGPGKEVTPEFWREFRLKAREAAAKMSERQS